MAIGAAWASVVFALLCSCPRGVLAQASDDEAVLERPATEAASREGAFLPLTLGSRLPGRAWAFGWGGYDSAAARPVAEAGAEVRLWRGLSVRGGAAYTGASDRLRPTVGLRYQALRQEAHGLDAGVAIFYRPEGLTEPEGEIEGLVFAGKSFGNTALFGNLVYGQDPDGHEHDAEVRAAVMHQVRRFGFGADTRLRRAIGARSSAPISIASPRYDIQAGPVATLSFDSLLLFCQVGPALVRLPAESRLGVVAMTGMGAAF